MAKKFIGLKQLRMGPVAGDGGMGTSLTVLQATVVDTATITNEAPTTTDFPIEEQTDPFYTTSVAGKKSFVFSTYDMTPAALVRLMGGTATDASGNAVDPSAAVRWNAPQDTPQIEQSFEITTQDNAIIRIPRGKVTVVMNLNFKKSALPQADVTVDILKPEKANLEPLSILLPS